MYQLSLLGFNPFFQEQIKGAATAVARIAAEHRGCFCIWSEAGEGWAQLSGRLTQKMLADDFSDAVVGVGDWVILKSAPVAGQTSLIESVLNRRTVFIRGAAGRATRAQIVAANVDIVFIVCGLDSDFNLHRLERYLARVWASGAQPVIVLNKSDVCDDLDERVAQVRLLSESVEIMVTSAIRAEGLESIHSVILPGLTAAFVGSSGAGKSTMINALLGEEKMLTQAIRSRDGRGCHTTTHRQLIWLPQGGLVIDTPGMRELQLFDDEGIDAVFSEIEELSAACRFRDCRHLSEPGCAIRAAVESGKISADRLEHYLKLHKEAQAYELRRDEYKRRKAERVWGKLTRQGDYIRRLKHGE